MTEVRALIVDVGGVLTTPVAGSFAAFCESEGLVLSDLRAAVGELLGPHDDDHPVAQLEMGRMELGPFETWLCGELNKALGTSIAPEGVGRRLVSNVQLEERMFEAVRRAREAGVRTGMLSNSWGNTDYGELTRFFDGVVISGAEGMRKPDARIYRLAAERVGAEPSACVFVDDIARNVDGAVAVGMHAIHHTDPDTTIPELESLLGVPLR
jgi:epoxide hydrolase-like predicted phosphatase